MRCWFLKDLSGIRLGIFLLWNFVNPLKLSQNGKLDDLKTKNKKNEKNISIFAYDRDEFDDILNLL